MRASSICWEFFIELSDEEVERLEKEALEGTLKVHDLDSVLGNFPLELKINDLTEKFQLYAELSTHPEKVYFREAKKYEIKLSQEGYKKLKEDGDIIDRIFNNSHCKVYIKVNKNNSKY